MQNDNLILSPENSTKNQFETTTTENDITTERSDVLFDTTHKIICHSNDIPLIPNSILIHSELNLTYNIGTTLYFKCLTEYQQTSFTTCLIH
jgi:hypothetical protein